MVPYISSARNASRAISLVQASEPQLASCGGVYLGRTAIYKTPVFLDAKELINPHIAVLGTSGAGKTYLIKSLIAKRVMHEGYSVSVIDWNGEYSELIKSLDGNVVMPSAESAGFDYGSLLSGVNSVDLSSLNSDTQKDFVSRSILHIIARLMRSSGISKSAKKMLVVDEAWRMFPNRADIGALFREGRKYGLSVVVASQLVSDINNEVLANCATEFIFRLHSDSDYDILRSMNIITDREKQRLSSLNVGGCLAIMGYSNHKALQSRIFVSRIEGVDLATLSIRGVKMSMQISKKRFAKVTEEHIERQDIAAKIYKLADESGSNIDACSIINALMGSGLARQEIVPFLKELGLPDLAIVRAFEASKNLHITLGD